LDITKPENELVSKYVSNTFSILMFFYIVLYDIDTFSSNNYSKKKVKFSLIIDLE